MKIVRPLPMTDLGAFTRPTTGVYRDYAGNLQTAAINSPRWDFDPNNLTAGPTLLVEPASTNIFYPSDLHSAPSSYGPAGEYSSIWTPMNLLGYQSSMLRIARVNSATDWTFEEWTLNGLSNGQAYMVSFYIMNDTVTDSTSVYIIDLDTNAASGVAVIWNAPGQLPTILPAYSGGGAASINAVEDVGGMMYRVSFQVPAGLLVAANRNRLRFAPSSAAGWVANEGVFFGGVQMEPGTALTTLIPTTGAAVARGAETMTARMLNNVVENDAAIYVPGTSYAVDAKVIYLSTDPTSGGMIHHVYQSAVAANLGNQPDISPAQWTDLGATVAWAAFDDKIGTQTSANDRLYFASRIAGRIDNLSLFNLQGSAVRITMTDAIEGVVYDRTISLIADPGSADWWSYFFEPIEYLTDLVVTDLPLYANALVTIYVANVGGVAACGTCVMGLSRNIGFTQYGASLGIQDFSVKTLDDWGNTIIQKRAYRSTAHFSVIVDNDKVARIKKQFADYRAEPIVYIGAEDFTPTVLYGFYSDFNVEIQYSKTSLCTVELVSLT